LSIVKIYSKYLFDRELTIEQLRNMHEPMKNVFLIDIFEVFLMQDNSLLFGKDIRALPYFEMIRTAVRTINSDFDSYI
jgi:hypothetical protein